MTTDLSMSDYASISAQEDRITPLVRQIMRVEDITWGQGKQNYVVRYRGTIVGNVSAAYEKLADALRTYDLTPLFRKEAERHVVVLMKGVVRPTPSNPWINLLLFIATVLSVVFTGTWLYLEPPASNSLSALLLSVQGSLGLGLSFAASILAILLAHEFGHYLAARYHGTAVTLPYFIPFPFSYFGTMGAFIRLKEPPKNKRILLDIGIAGPLAGLVVAIPILIIGLLLSDLDNLPLSANPGVQLEGNSILYLLAKYAVFGQWLPNPSSYGGLNPVLYWIRYFFTGMPAPLGGTDVVLHPVAWAGWAGLLVTALNLIPAGQLDGGHVLYVLFGNRARAALPFILTALVVLGTVWPGWWLWAFLIFLLGRVYAEPLDQITALDSNRRAVAILGLIVFILVFTPVPLSVLGI
ncbi:MAG TPA: site-2 protease family protein [Anaerolineales bacterium]